MNTAQVKSKTRVTEHGEVFTAEREVNAMLDLVQAETERIESRFLEPACGNGNFLAAVLMRKLKTVARRYAAAPLTYEYSALQAVASLYGVELLADNAQECRERLMTVMMREYSALYAATWRLEYERAVRYVLNKNIVWGDALDLMHPVTKAPLVFVEWSFLKGGFMKRRDFVFRFLVEKTHQFALFNDVGQPAAIDEPIKTFPLMYYLQLGTGDDDEL